MRVEARARQQQQRRRRRRDGQASAAAAEVQAKSWGEVQKGGDARPLEVGAERWHSGRLLRWPSPCAGRRLWQWERQAFPTPGPRRHCAVAATAPVDLQIAILLNSGALAAVKFGVVEAGHRT